LSPPIILISGAPCTGKTTLSKQLSPALKIPLISKDGMKERMFDALDFDTMQGEESNLSKKIGAATSDLLYYLIEQHLKVMQPLIVESNFDNKYASPSLRQLKSSYEVSYIEVHCKADTEVLVERYLKRAQDGSRHPIHFDQERADSYRIRLQDDTWKPLKINAHLLVVDTTDFTQVNFKSILQDVKLLIAKGETTWDN
jgi:adenylate kinase family enzyme